MREPRLHHVDTTLERDEALAAVETAAEMWGAQWQREGTSGRLVLPVRAGMRRGLMRGRVWTEPASRPSRGTRINFEVEDSQYTVHWQAVFILLLGALGALTVTLWPFFPALLAAAPVAIVLALAAWFLVVVRLRSSGPEDFLATLTLGEDAPEGETPDPPQPIRP